MQDRLGTDIRYLILKAEIINWLLLSPVEQPLEGTKHFVSTSLARFLGSSGFGVAEAKAPSKPYHKSTCD